MFLQQPLVWDPVPTENERREEGDRARGNLPFLKPFFSVGLQSRGTFGQIVHFRSIILKLNMIILVTS